MQKLKLLLWGTGKIADEVLTQCKTLDLYEIVGIIDNNPEKSGTIFHNYYVFAPSKIHTVNPDKIVVLTDAYDAIKSQVKALFPEFMDRMENKNFFYKESLLKKYRNTEDPEIKLVIENIKKYGLEIFNYSFISKYKNISFDIYYDKNVALYYVFHYGKKLYFSRDYSSEKAVADYYKAILLEQDDHSPHKYLDGDFTVEDDAVVIDAGVAEGNFALEIVDRVSKIYLIEANKNWIEALKITFREYNDKVIIIEAFVSSFDEGCFFKLDTLIKDKVNFIKMDIEGNEWDGLLGAREIIARSEKLKLAICSYHSDFDQTLIEDFMDEMHINHSTTKGYIWFPLRVRQNYVSTKLNRAIVRGIK